MQYEYEKQEEVFATCFSSKYILIYFGHFYMFMVWLQINDFGLNNIAIHCRIINIMLQMLKICDKNMIILSFIRITIRKKVLPRYNKCRMLQCLEQKLNMSILDQAVFNNEVTIANQRI